MDDAVIDAAAEGLYERARREGWDRPRIESEVRKLVKASRGSAAPAPGAVGEPPATVPATTGREQAEAYDPYGDRDPTQAEYDAMGLAQVTLLEEARPGVKARMAGREKYRQAEVEQAKIEVERRLKRAHEERLASDPAYRAQEHRRIASERLAREWHQLSSPERLEKAHEIGADVLDALSPAQKFELEGLDERKREVPRELWSQHAEAITIDGKRYILREQG